MELIAREYPARTWSSWLLCHRSVGAIYSSRRRLRAGTGWPPRGWILVSPPSIGWHDGCRRGRSRRSEVSRRVGYPRLRLLQEAARSNSRAASLNSAKVAVADGRHVDDGGDQAARSPWLPIATILEGRHMSTACAPWGRPRCPHVMTTTLCVNAQELR